MEARFGKLGDLLNKITVSNEKVQRWKEQKDLVSFSYKDWYKFIEHNKSFKIFNDIIEEIKTNYTYLDNVSVYSCWSKIQEHKLILPDGLEILWNDKQNIYEIKNIIECNKSESLIALIQSCRNIKPTSIEVTRLLNDSLNLSNKKTIKLIRGLLQNLTQNDESLLELRNELNEVLNKLEEELIGGY